MKESQKVALITAILLSFIIFSTLTFTRFNTGNCESNNEYHTKTGIVEYTEWYGGTIGVYFVNGDALSLSGSPNAKYNLEEMINLIAPNVNYTFYFHKDCVQSDGNTIHYYEGNVIDKIKVN